MDLLFLIKDIKIIMLIILVALLAGLTIYSFRQSRQLKLMKEQQEKIKEQLKHQVLLNGSELERPEMASNMSEESQSAEEDENWQARRDGADNHDESESESEEDHSAYIREIIKMQDAKLSPDKDYYLGRQKENVESLDLEFDDEENITFDNIEEISESESERDAPKQPDREAREVREDLKIKAESELIKRIESDLKRSEQGHNDEQERSENPKPLEDNGSKVKPKLILKPKAAPAAFKRPRGRPRKV